jgi:hypothetical protein
MKTELFAHAEISGMSETLRRGGKDPFIDMDRKEAFDKLVEAWASDFASR